MHKVIVEAVNRLKFEIELRSDPKILAKTVWRHLLTHTVSGIFGIIGKETE
jgi:hypothetical protein